MGGITLDTIDYAFHSISIKDSGGDELAISASGEISVLQAGTWNIGTVTTVTAVTDITNVVSVDDNGSTLSIDDGGGSITVDGTVTTSLGSEVNEDDAIASGQVINMIGLYRQDTLATDTSADGDASFGKVSALGELYVKDSTLSAAISGSEVQVDVVGALPAGDNNIGNVDIVTMPGIYVEDAASSGGENLMLIGGYRQDADTSPVSADGDYHGFIFNALGELKVSSKLDDVANSSLVVTTVTVDTTVGGVQLVSALSNRRSLIVQNLGAVDVWIKAGTGVTSGPAGNGFLLPKGSSISRKWGDAIDLYGISASSSSTIKVIEAA